MPDRPLTDHEKQLLDFERQSFLHEGIKERRVRETFGLSLPQYLLALRTLLDRPEAWAEAPGVLARLEAARHAAPPGRSGRGTRRTG